MPYVQRWRDRYRGGGGGDIDPMARLVEKYRQYIKLKPERCGGGRINTRRQHTYEPRP